MSVDGQSDGAPAMNDRVETLEGKLALAEDAIDALNLTVFRMQQQLDLLRREMVALVRRDQAQAEDRVSSEGRIDATIESSDNVAAARDDTPPHY